MNRNETRRQHYVQRAYLENFCINNGEYINAYNIKTGKEQKLKSKALCVIKDMYEIHGVVDNKIEKHIKEYEDKGIVQINKIITTKTINSDLLSEKDLEDLYKYVFLQLMRTKSGQLIFQSVKENSNFSKPRRHVSNKDLSKNEDIIERNINWIHDNINEFDSVIDSLWSTFHNSTRFGLYISKQALLITTDNPVYTDVKPSLAFPYLCYFKMAVSPKILLDIEILLQSRKIKEENRFFKCKLTSNIANDFNSKIISNANYWVMSSNTFSNSQKQILEEQNKKMLETN